MRSRDLDQEAFLIDPYTLSQMSTVDRLWYSERSSSVRLFEERYLRLLTHSVQLLFCTPPPCCLLEHCSCTSPQDCDFGTFPPQHSELMACAASCQIVDAGQWRLHQELTCLSVASMSRTARYGFGFGFEKQLISSVRMLLSCPSYGAQQIVCTPNNSTEQLAWQQQQHHHNQP